MAIEAIKGAGMTYQGSASTAERIIEIQPKLEAASNIAASEQLAKDTMAMNTKKAGSEDADGSNSNEMTQEQLTAQIKKAVEDINKKAVNSEAIFGIHDKTNRVTIKIVDKSTKEVIKELPPEKTLDMIAKVWEMAGLMVDEKR